jgi:malonate transporter
MLLTNLQTIVVVIVPIFVLIALGHALYRAGFPGDAFWLQLERLVYFLLLPALLVEKLATAEVDETRLWPVALAVAMTVAGGTALVLGLRRVLPVDGPGFTSVYQAAVRFNTYIGLAVALSLYGREGVAVAAMTVAFLVPLVNVLSVGVLAHYTESRASLAGTARSVMSNPLILACLLGLVLNGTGLGLPLGTEVVLKMISPAALPLGLMAVGAGLRLESTRASARVLATGVGLKLVVMPVIAWIAAWLLGLSVLEMQILVLFAALPTATSAYILARQLGGDHTLVATLLTAQTAASALTLPVVLLLIGS